jgi:hypothetical protein
MGNKKNFYCFLDESFGEKIFCLGGILIEESEMHIILDKWRDYKTSLGLTPSTFIKWSLGDNKEEKKIKDTLRSTFREERDWLTTFRNRTLNEISSFNLTLLASLHQDVRRRSDRLSPVDFYLWAFKFILQRIWWQVRNSDYTIFVIIDKPPESKGFKHAEKRICECYKNAYENGFQFDDNSIPPLKNTGFFESPLVTKGNFCSFIQISEFVVGAIAQRAKDLLRNRHDSKSKGFLKAILLKFHSERGEIIRKGLVVFPPNRELLSLIQQDINSMIEEGEENDLPF